jgi:hypothetical protein
VSISLSVRNSNARRSVQTLTIYCDLSFQWHWHMWLLFVLLLFLRSVVAYFTSPFSAPPTLFHAYSSWAYLALTTQNWLDLETQCILHDDTNIPSDADRLSLWSPHSSISGYCYLSTANEHSTTLTTDLHLLLRLRIRYLKKRAKGHWNVTLCLDKLKDTGSRENQTTDAMAWQHQGSNRPTIGRPKRSSTR